MSVAESKDDSPTLPAGLTVAGNVAANQCGILSLSSRMTRTR
jgi:hypothetical protein